METIQSQRYAEEFTQQTEPPPTQSLNDPASIQNPLTDPLQWSNHSSQISGYLQELIEASIG